MFDSPHRFAADQPRFRAPLAPAVLDDPAFSDDPREHPHFPLADVTAIRQSPALSSHARALPPSPAPPTSVPPNPPRHSPPRASTRVRVQKRVPSHNSSTPRRASMKALVRRLTSHHNLDRIDELDETDPFGSSYHHDGPYEATATNHVQPAAPRMHADAAPRRANTVHHSRREFNSRPSHPTRHQSPPRAPSIHSENGLSLHLEPGQILQHNTIYASHFSSITSVPGHFRRPPSTLASVPQPDHFRGHSLPNPRTRSLEDSSNRPPLFPRAPSQRYLGDNPPDIPDTLPPHHDHDPAPYVPSQTEMTVFPPPRYESRLHISGSSPTTPKLMPQKTQAAESPLPAFPSRGPRHKSVHSLDSSHTINTTITQSSSTIQIKSIDPPRIRHLPKRLVMPAPLQPQQPQPQYNFPLAEPVVWQDGYPDDHILEGANFEEQPAMYAQGPRLLRKKSSAFPEKTPIPHHVAILQNDAVSIMGDISTKTANEPEGTKEKTRRRRLSKRKSDF